MRATPIRSYLVLAALAAALASCGGEAETGPGAPASPDRLRSPAPAPAPAERHAAAVTSASGPTCSPSGAHGAHEAMVQDCRVCHACGGAYEFTAITLRGGTTTVGGELVRGNPTTCTVACHNVPGATPAPTIAWNAVGPLACTSCHIQPATAVTKHAVAQADPISDREGCTGCHVQDRHLGGSPRIQVGDQVVEVNPADPGALDAACQGCHDGYGKPIAENTPPLLVSWTDTVGGDFHGARIGTGTSLGATLKSPFVRGQGPLPCTMCHAAHASQNAYLFAAPAPIDRSGVGAERLCMACHDGERHAWCISCHGGDPRPAGSACFSCHGHEGIVNFVPPGSYNHDSGDPADDSVCYHCHTSWAPATDLVAPQIVSSVVNVQGLTGSSATITWTTNEPATSFVEWGVGTARDRMTGDRDLQTSHAVTITGLAPTTTYTFRVRTADASRNLTRSEVRSFDSPDPTAPPSPELVLEPSFTSCGSPAYVTLEWLPVQAPDGHSVEYRVVVDDTAAFDSLVRDSGWIAATQYATSFAVTTSRVTYYWRVQARDPVEGKLSPWTALDDFQLNRYRLGSCP